MSNEARVWVALVGFGLLVVKPQGEVQAPRLDILKPYHINGDGRLLEPGDHAPWTADQDKEDDGARHISKWYTFPRYKRARTGA